MSDNYLGTCLECGQRTNGPRVDFCDEERCQDESQDNFGRCYNCHDGDHDECVGVPCQCACPTPDQRAREALREQALSKLTPQERAALGV